MCEARLKTYGYQLPTTMFMKKRAQPPAPTENMRGASEKSSRGSLFGRR